MRSKGTRAERAEKKGGVDIHRVWGSSIGYIARAARGRVRKKRKKNKKKVVTKKYQYQTTRVRVRSSIDN